MYLFEFCLVFVLGASYANDRMTVAGVHHSALTDSSLAASSNYLITGGRQLMDRPPNKYNVKNQTNTKQSSNK